MHSDPKHELLLRTVGAEPGSAAEHSLYRKKEFDSLASAGYKRYTMVQPAFVVVDKTGNVSQGPNSIEKVWLEKPLEFWLEIHYTKKMFGNG